MKKVIILLSLAFLLITGCGRGPAENTITLSGAWALYPMAVKWAEAYRAVHPEVRIDIGAGGAGKGMADCLSGAVDLGMVSRTIDAEEIRRGAWFVAVTRDAVVATFNAQNPDRDILLKRGVRRDECIALWREGKKLLWWELGGRTAQPVRVYTRSDACGAAQTWAEYLGGNQEDLREVGVYGDPGLAEAVRSDRFGIGYNNINYVYDATTRKPVPGLLVLPLDSNGNGRIDAEENFYQTREQLVAAIGEGRYPAPPARDLYFVSNGRPQRKVVADFINWVLSEGQKYVHESGYIPLGAELLRQQSRKLDE